MGIFWSTNLHFNIGLFLARRKFYNKDNYKKVSRLWPTYVVAVFVICITTTMFQLEGRTVSNLGFLANCLMLNGFIGIGYVDGVHWYITTLIPCVIVSSILNKIKAPLKSICVVCWNIVVVFLSISIPSNRLLYLFRSELLVLMGGPMFAAGYCMHMLNSESKRSKNYFALCSSNLANFIIMNTECEIVFIAAICCFVLAINSKLRILENKIIVWIGSISCSVYLIHKNIGCCIINYEVKLLERYEIGLSVLAIVIVCVMGIALYYVVEKPCNAWMKENAI